MCIILYNLFVLKIKLSIFGYLLIEIVFVIELWNQEVTKLNCKINFIYD